MRGLGQARIGPRFLAQLLRCQPQVGSLPRSLNGLARLRTLVQVRILLLPQLLFLPSQVTGQMHTASGRRI